MEEEKKEQEPVLKEARKDWNISNTLINAYTAYKKNEECGLRVQKVYIEKVVNSGSGAAMKGGLWFEWQALFDHLTDEDKLKEPEQILTPKTGKPAAAMKNITAQLDNFKNIYQEIEIHEVQKVLETTIDGIKYKGIIDVLAETKEEGIHIRDVKLTGHLNNKWEEYGWEAMQGNGGAIPEKKGLKQSKFYVWLWFHLTGELVPMYFDVFASNNSDDCKTIRVYITEEGIEEIGSDIQNSALSIREEMKNGGLKPIADMNRCNKCEFNHWCEHKTNKPRVEHVFIQ